MSNNLDLAMAAATATGTLSLAAVGALTLKQGRRALRQGSDLLKAATDEARAADALVSETQADRRFAARPALSISWTVGVPSPAMNSRAIVVNSGAGAALDCVVVARRDPHYAALSRSFNLAAGGVETEVHLLREVPDGAARPLLEWKTRGGDAGREAGTVMIARDALDARYRFIIATDDSGGAKLPFVLRLEEWRPGSGDPPPWATSPVVWPTD